MLPSPRSAVQFTAYNGLFQVSVGVPAADGRLRAPGKRVDSQSPRAARAARDVSTARVMLQHPTCSRVQAPGANQLSKLPCLETFLFGGARVQELHGTSTCSLGESWDMKHAEEFEAMLHGFVWDDLPLVAARRYALATGACWPLPILSGSVHH